LTPVEAIVSGVPAVVYDSEVARETLSGLARFVPAGDIEALAALGVGAIDLSFGGNTAAAMLEEMKRFAGEVMAKA
jgi:glycosyltransferase involved in cell wall biosynthesis